MFPFVLYKYPLLVFSWSFRYFLIFVGFCTFMIHHVLFLALFHREILQKARTPPNWLQIEHCWVLLSTAKTSKFQSFPILFPCVLLVFPIVFSKFVFYFFRFLRYFLIFVGFCTFMYLASNWNFAKSKETLKLVANWALLSAAECCWVLLRNAISILFPSFFHVFCWLFPLFSPNLMVCFFHFAGISWYLSAFVPLCMFFTLKSQGNLEISCRLSTGRPHLVQLKLSTSKP